MKNFQVQQESAYEWTLRFAVRLLQMGVKCSFIHGEIVVMAESEEEYDLVRQWAEVFE